MDPWYRVVTPRREVREGRSFNPDEFAIALEQVVAGTAPEDYTKPEQFFSRTCFTRALKDHAGMVLKRLAGKTENTAPVLTLITQFGSLTRLLDPDAVLKGKIVEFVTNGELGLASGAKADGTYERLWFDEPVSPDEVSFEANVFLLTKAKAKALKTKPAIIEPPIEDKPPEEKKEDKEKPSEETPPGRTTLRLSGTLPPEVWNRLGTKLITKLRSGDDLKIEVGFSVSIDAKLAGSFESELRQILEDLGLADKVRIEKA